MTSPTSTGASRVLVIGLDCAPPALVFGRYREVMPHVAGLMQRGAWGPLRSCVPPITVPAWTCMVSGRDPGELGLYGFRQRLPQSYGMRLSTARDLRVKRLWDWLGEAGKRVATLGVPLTWPPTPLRGDMVSCCLTPDAGSEWSFPPALKQELEERFGAYRADLPADFRVREPEAMLRELYAMAEQHFGMAKALWEEKRPDFLMMVEIGVDRLHHLFWHRIDSDDDRIGRDYYAFVDAQIGRLLSVIDEDTAVLVVSDHGARRMEGALCLNEWLVRQGWLVLREPLPPTPTPLSALQVDWSRTRAWAEGGYYGRIFLNVAGREPQGCVAARDVESELRRLRASLGSIDTDQGRRLRVEAHRPQELYRSVQGQPPDLLVFVEDLAWRLLGSLGHRDAAGQPTVFSRRNDRGDDGCNHDWEGIAILSGAGVKARGRLENLQIYDIAPTVLELLGVPTPPRLLGRARHTAEA